MAQEVDLNALKELEREAILQVLYRDQEVQNAEEERIRYPWGHLGFQLSLLGACHSVSDAACFQIATHLLLGFMTEKGPNKGLLVEMILLMQLNVEDAWDKGGRSCYSFKTVRLGGEFAVCHLLVCLPTWWESFKGHFQASSLPLIQGKTSG